MTEPQTALTHAPEANVAVQMESHKSLFSIFIPKSMTSRMLFVILLSAMLPTLIVGWLGYTTIYNNSKADKMHDVGLVADLRQYQLTFTLRGANSRATQFLEINLNRCNALFGRSTTQTESCLRSALTIFVEREKAAGATLHRPKAGDLAVGTLTAGSPDSWKLQPGQLAVFPPAQNQSDRVYHVPVTDSQTQSRLVMTYPVSLMQDIFVPQPALGHSGETFLADSNGFFITKPRYKSVQGHSMAISAVPMRTCLQQKNMEMLELDYRAVQIIHGFRYIPEIGGGCIMAHFDQQEAFAPLEALKRKLIAIALAFGLLAGIVAFYLTRQITKPLNNLGRTAGSIVDGSEKIEISERGPIEVVSLAHSFNLMLKRLSQVIGKLNLSMSELRQANIKLEVMRDQLMRSEKILNEAQQLAHIGSWERDLMTNSLICSKEIFRIFEIDPAHGGIFYEAFILTVYPEDREMVDHAYMTCFKTREPFDIVHRLLLSNGRVKWVNEHGTFHYDSNGVPLRSIGTIQDITERKQAEEKLHKYNEELEAINHQLQDTQNQLLQSEKMSSIGQLAAGVAHEINNPIGYVYSNLGTLERYVQDTFGMIELYEREEWAIGDEAARARLKAARDKLDIEFLKKDLRALMNESKDGIVRVKKIVQDLKDFSHVDTSDEWHFADLRKGLDSTLNIVNNEIKYKASVVREYGDIPEVECLSSQLNQVFMNLLVNAAHAIEERGTITIRTGTLRTGQQGEEVWVEIADTGKGIAPEHLKKIFDPFFTTKPIGKGTGLGLSLSYSIIQKHHGRIEVQSEVGKGTTFRVWLPVKQNREGAGNADSK